MNRPSSQIKSLQDAWDILKRFRWRFIVPAFLIVSAVLAVGLMLPRKYQAQALFERRTDMVLNEIMNRGGSPVIQKPRQSLNQELAGPLAVDKLVSQIQDVIKTPRVQDAGKIDVQALRNELERLVLVKYDISSTTLDRVSVNYITQNPIVARMVVNGLVNNYIDKTRKDITDKLRESARFFDGEVQRCRKNIEDIENQKLVYEIKHGSLLPDSPNSVQLALNDAHSQLDLARQNLETTTLKVKALTTSFADTQKVTPSVITKANPDLTKLQDQLEKLLATENQYVNVLKMKPKHPDLIALRENIARVRDVLATTPSQVVTEQRMDSNPQYGQMNMMLTQAKVEKQTAEKTVTVAQAKLASLNDQAQNFFPVRAAYSKISRDVDQQQRQLTFWEDNLRRVQMAISAESGKRGILLDFIKPCEAIKLPISPNLFQVFMAALLLGLIAGGISVLAAYRADESFQEGEELSKEFELPLLGAVSELISRRQRQVRRLKLVVVYPICGLLMTGIVAALAGTMYVSLHDPRALPIKLSVLTHSADQAGQTPKEQHPKAKPVLPTLPHDSLSMSISMTTITDAPSSLTKQD